jgi:hypothetical protein
MSKEQVFEQLACSKVLYEQGQISKADYEQATEQLRQHYRSQGKYYTSAEQYFETLDRVVQARADTVAAELLADVDLSGLEPGEVSND